jgi:hypothetical protein
MKSTISANTNLFDIVGMRARHNEYSALTAAARVRPFPWGARALARMWQ